MTAAPSTSQLSWYAHRFARMSPAEVAWRARDQAVQAAWSRRQVTRERVATAAPVPGGRGLSAILPPDTAALVPGHAKAAVVEAADRLMRGEWEVLGIARMDLIQPDWFSDPVTGRHAPSDRYAFRINYRSPEQVGDVKQVWELSRLHHLTLLATAWFLTGDEAYASRVADHLRSWWRENPFLSGIHWTSGIEVGIRLISMVWIRRLLDGWPGAASLFEHDPLAVQQIYWHQKYLAAFRSRGSSANNHVIAEAAGRLAASCAFPWFRESRRWQRASASLFARELMRNTFPSGIDRELASGYQCFVAELGLLAAIEAEAGGCPLSTAVWQRLCSMIDSAAALPDQSLRPPRQGDCDDGHTLLLDAPTGACWRSLLAMGEPVFGRLDWWPHTEPDVRSSIIAGLARGTGLSRRAAQLTGRPSQRAWRFPDAGITLLRTGGTRDPEIWCRCDGGPHGYLSIAAHAHADALSVEVRYGGVDILADPGTYCYHTEPAWRSYFRSTIAHNTVELDGQSQSSHAGPFLWLRQANAREIEVLDTGDAVSWTAEHDGYLSLRPPARHRRSVRLDRLARCLEITDDIRGGSHDIRIAFHFGPDVRAEQVDSACAALTWAGAATPGGALLILPSQLQWSLHRGETDPILGWYAPSLGWRMPAFTLIGSGRAPGVPFTTRLQFLDFGLNGEPDITESGVSRSASDALMSEVQRFLAEAG